MNRPKAMLCILFVLGMCAPSTFSATIQKPNILFIIVDDQSPFDLKIYDPKSELDTPNIDRLAAEGIVLDGAYHMGSWSGAVCTPSRHMVMSGRTVWHLPKQKQHCTPDLPEYTMAAVFNRAGYDTMRTCKKGNSYGAANEKFTVRHDATKRGGTDESGSAWHAEQVLNYLNDRQATNDKDPFLIYFGFSHPHDTRDGKPELLKHYGAVNHKDINTLPALHPDQPVLPANYLPEHPFFHGHPKLRDEERVSGVWKNRDQATIRNELGREFACSENIDIQIGRVLKKLEEMGELDHTIIFYTSDHGIAIGRHGLQGKQNLYEHTWRVPYIVKGPGIKAASRAPGNIYLLDTLATLCDLAGIEPPKTNEGISFKPVLEGKKQTVRDVLFGVYCGGTKPGIRSVRKGDWKLIKYDVMDGTVRETQLFNLSENPDEFLAEHHEKTVVDLTKNQPKKNQVNLADNPKYADKLAEMEALLLSEMKRHDDPYRLWNQGEQPQQTSKIKEKLNRPNIILCMCDDLGWGNVGYHGIDSEIKTPHLDKMSQSGLQFRRFYAAAPVCSPTRGSVITARHPYRYGIFFTNKGHMKKEEFTIAEALKPLGYRTGHFGKWHLGSLTTEIKDSNRGGNPKLVKDFSPPWENGFDVCYSTDAKVPTWNPMYKPGTKEFYGTRYWKQDATFVDPDSPELQGDDSRVIMDQAIPFIRESAEQDKPFLAVIWFHTPHKPIVAGPEYKAMYSHLDEDKQEYYGCITAMDEQMGRLRTELRKLGIADNTMLWFTSDNGPEFQTPGITGGFKDRKRSLYEGGVRVPGLLEWPTRIRTARVTDFPSCTSDYLPTIIEVLGYTPKELEGSVKPIDGISLVPLIDGTMDHRPEPIGFQSKNQRALSDNRYKIYSSDEGNTYELYDLIEDPYEKKDIAASKPDVVESMKKILEEWIESCAKSNDRADYN
ncbi:MAG: sulfatase-like hydrolase/transferase [Phycisphaerae bacterium]|nr:sulfatase-like hydrolase/transferase [Phycisphaerae bacterium]